MTAMKDPAKLAGSFIAVISPYASFRLTSTQAS